MVNILKDWVSYLVHNKGRSEATAAKYQRYIQRLMEWAGDRSLKSLEREELEQFVGIVMHQAGLSPRSRRALVAAVKGFYSFMRRRGVIGDSPADGLEYPKAGARMPSIISLKNAEKLLMMCDLTELKGVRDAAILGVLIGAGLRVSGLVNLNQSSLVWWNDDKGREVLILRILEKGDKERLVPVPAETRYLIRAYLAHPDLKLIDRSLPDGDQVLFISLRNRKVSPDRYYGEARRISTRSINDMIENYGDRAGIPRDQLHPHAFRHLYGAELVETEIPDSIGQTLMGHADPRSYQVYNNLALRKLVDVVNRANPLGKIHTPVTSIIKSLEK